MRAYQQFAQLTAAAGVRAVFGVMGDGNMHWVATYRDLPGCHWYPAWHEAGAVWMADGWAHASGDLGVATVTMGPGLAQALPAIMTAVRARTPLVLVSAALPDATPPLAQHANQRALVEAAGARYVEVNAADGMAAGLAAACTSARRGTPAVLAVDLAVFEECDAVDQVPPAAAAPDPAAPDAAVLDAAADALMAAKAPVVLLGGGVRDAGCLREALALGRRVGAAFGTTIGGRVALADEPWNLGVLGMMAGPVGRAVVDSADVVLVLGAALDRYNTDGCRLGQGARMVRVDERAPDELWTPALDTLDVTGNLPDVLAGLATRLGEYRATGLRAEALRYELDRERARQDALADEPTSDGPNPWAVVQELDRSLPGDAYVVVGIGHFWYFVAPYLRPEPQRAFHFACGFASIGQALPVGVGAALAGTGRPVVVVEGDGSVVMNMQELQAAVRHDADLLVVVLDNRAYGSEYHKLRMAGLDPSAGAFDETPFDLVAVASAMGATARGAADHDELREALGELGTAKGVRLLDARISPSTMSETYVRQHVHEEVPDRMSGRMSSRMSSGSSHPAASSMPATSNRSAR